jgi:hypothetical protein
MNDHLELRYRVKPDSRLGRVLQFMRDTPVSLPLKEQVERILCGFLLPIVCCDDEEIDEHQSLAIAIESIQMLEIQAVKIRRMYSIGYATLPAPTVQASPQAPPQTKSSDPKAAQVTHPQVLTNQVSQEELEPYFKRRTC